MSGGKTKSKSAKPGFNQPFDALKELKKRLEEEEKAALLAKTERRAPPPPRAREKERPSKGTSAASGESAADDALAFHRMMSGVTPLDQARGRIPRSTQALDRGATAELSARRANATTALAAETQAVHDHLRTLVEGAARFEVSDDGQHVEGRRLDLPPDALRKLRRGLLPIDGRIDLHGMRVPDARAKLEVFLREQRARGERCALVVHGKGEHSPGGIGVLRGEIAAWLSQTAASEHVAAFATATLADGGEGAMYVLLRR